MWKNQVQHLIQYIRSFLLCIIFRISYTCKTCGYQPDELDDNLIENSHEKRFYPPRTKLTFQEKQCTLGK